MQSRLRKTVSPPSPNHVQSAPPLRKPLMQKFGPICWVCVQGNSLQTFQKSLLGMKLARQQPSDSQVPNLLYTDTCQLPPRRVLKRSPQNQKTLKVGRQVLFIHQVLHSLVRQPSKKSGPKHVGPFLSKRAINPRRDCPGADTRVSLDYTLHCKRRRVLYKARRFRHCKASEPRRRVLRGSSVSAERSLPTTRARCEAWRRLT